MRRKITIAVLLALLAPVTLLAQNELDGTWSIEADYTSEVMVAAVQVVCYYTGSGLINGSMGPISLMLDRSDPPGSEEQCEPKIGGMATVALGKDGMSVSGTVMDASQDTGSFTGVLQMTAAPQPAATEITRGQTMITSGPFADLVANFRATLAPVAPSLPAPAAGLLLAVLVAGGGYMVLRRRELQRSA